MDKSSLQLPYLELNDSQPVYALFFHEKLDFEQYTTLIDYHNTTSYLSDVAHPSHPKVV
ncbi:hypothetical protein LguiA_029132 [Lonicera macranthoides]